MESYFDWYPLFKLFITEVLVDLVFAIVVGIIFGVWLTSRTFLTGDLFLF